MEVPSHSLCYSLSHSLSPLFLYFPPEPMSSSSLFLSLPIVPPLSLAFSSPAWSSRPMRIKSQRSNGEVGGGTIGNDVGLEAGEWSGECRDRWLLVAARGGARLIVGGSTVSWVAGGGPSRAAGNWSRRGRKAMRKREVLSEELGRGGELGDGGDTRQSKARSRSEVKRMRGGKDREEGRRRKKRKKRRKEKKRKKKREGKKKKKKEKERKRRKKMEE